MRPARNVPLTLLIAGLGLSVVGDYVALFALTLRLHDSGGSGLEVAGLLLAGTLPPVLLAPWSGLLVDRLENGRLVQVVAVTQACVAVALAFVHGRAETLLLMGLIGCGAALVSPAIAALTPVVAPGEVMYANALTESAVSVGAMLGPLLGALVTATIGARWCLLLDAATFAAVAVTTRLTHAVRRPANAPGDPRPRARDGLVAIANDPLLRVVLATMVPTLIVVAGSNVGEVFLVKDVLRAGDVAFGIVVASWMFGMLIGARVLGRRESAHDGTLTSLFMTSTVVMGVVIAAAGLSRTVVLLPVMFVLGGAMNGVNNVARRTLMHRRVAEGTRGRAFAAYSGVTNAALLVAFVAGGLMVNTFGARVTFVVGGIATSLVGMAGYARTVAVRRAVVRV